MAIKMDEVHIYSVQNSQFLLVMLKIKNNLCLNTLWTPHKTCRIIQNNIKPVKPPVHQMKTEVLHHKPSTVHLAGRDQTPQWTSKAEKKAQKSKWLNILLVDFKKPPTLKCVQDLEMCIEKKTRFQDIRTLLLKDFNKLAVISVWVYME